MLIFLVIGIVFLIIPAIFSRWVEKHEENITTISNGILGIVLIIEWFSFLLGFFLSDIIRK